MQASVVSSVDESGLLSALRTTRLEIEALQTLDDALRASSLRHSFLAAVSAIGAEPGRLIVTGMGKSGSVGR